jgi:hypothetical protein
MAKRHHPATTTEDTVVLAAKAREELEQRYRTPSIQDLLQFYNGNKRELVAALAGTNNPKDTAYRTMQRNVNRWLQGTRSPSASTKARFDALVAHSKATFAAPPSGSVHATIRGTIGYDDNVRYRTLSFNIPAHLFIPIMQKAASGDSHGAYADLMSIYFERSLGEKTPITVYGDESLSITFD